MGYQIDENGLSIAKEKVEAITKMKTPENVVELRSFLGALTLFAMFIKNFAMIVSPLYELLRDNVKWQWTHERDNAFKEAKERLSLHDVLVNYSTTIPIKVTCDASPTGLEAVLFHIFSKGVQKPVAYASSILTSAESNYSQLEKEALALVIGVKKFHQYVYGRNFELETDHKPLTSILGSKKGLPQMAASRVQR